MGVKVEKKPKVYNWEDKLQALILLRDNNFNAKKTANELGIAHVTLRMWKSRYGAKVYGDIDKRVPNPNKEYGIALTNIGEEMKGLHTDFIRRAMNVKIKALERLEKLLKTEKNTSKVTEAIRLLHEISSDKPTNGEEAGTVNTYINYNPPLFLGN